jgi:hypothetical protein
MPSVEMICLANSHKYGHRCIAGIRSDGSGWIRPVSNGEHGELEYRDYALTNDSQPFVLDAIRIGVSKHQPTLNHPEDWLINSSAWKLISRPAPVNLGPVLGAAIQQGDLLFGDGAGSIPIRDVESRGGVASLTLVRPENVRWRTARQGEWKKARVLFQLGNRRYNLPLTDPRYAGRVTKLEIGDHQDHEVEIETGAQYLFTVSLGEPFDDGRCYKLVAGVVEIPPEWTISSGPDNAPSGVFERARPARPSPAPPWYVRLFRRLF